MLTFEARPPFSFGRFVGKCPGFIPDNAIEVLRRLAEGGEYPQDEACPGVLKKWRAFDTALRNELVKLRAAHKKEDPEKYLRPQPGRADLTISHIAISARRNPQLMEAERFLDQQRWQYLEELVFGHYFDLDFLIVYGLKILILERWERIREADKKKIIEEVLRVN